MFVLYYWEKSLFIKKILENISKLFHLQERTTPKICNWQRTWIFWGALNLFVDFSYCYFSLPFMCSGFTFCINFVALLFVFKFLKKNCKKNKCSIIGSACKVSSCSAATTPRRQEINEIKRCASVWGPTLSRLVLCIAHCAENPSQLKVKIRATHFLKHWYTVHYTVQHWQSQTWPLE